MRQPIYFEYHMELRHLRYFLTLSDVLHFGNAARILNMTQPPLSMQIQQLEEELGVQLFDRSQKQVKLTKCGRFFQRRVRSILSEIEVSVEDTRSIERGDMDPIRIGYRSGIMLQEISFLLRRFQETYPDASLSFIQANVDEQYNAILDHRIDVGFVEQPVQVSEIHSRYQHISGIPVIKERLVMAVPDTHPLRERKKVQLKDFASDRFIFVDRQSMPSIHEMWVGMCQQAGFSPNIKCYADNLQEILAFVAAGYGVALAPESIANKWPGPIQFLNLRDNAYVIISMIFRNDHESKAVQYFRQLISR